MIFTAPAKINLFLHITGRRDTGYHELESLFAFTHHGDEISVQPQDHQDDHLEITGPFADDLIRAGGVGTDNLMLKAASLVRDYSKIKCPPVRLTLKKNLPIGAGIGSGSADAAATLLALDRFWALGLQDAELDRLALALGADVPACLSSSPQWVTGIGEIRRSVHIDLPRYTVLVNPRVHVATPDIFRAYKDQGQAFDRPAIDPQAVLTDVNALADDTDNSLQQSAQQLAPEINHCLAVLSQMDQAKFVRMSGSGATCFALFDCQSAAKDAADKIKALMPHWWVTVDQLHLK